VIPKTIRWCLRAHHALFWKNYNLYQATENYLVVIPCVERNIFNNLCKVLRFKTTKIYTFSKKNYLKIALKEYENEKTRYLRTFGCIEIDWRCIWSHTLILRIYYALNNFSISISVIERRTENLLAHSKLKHDVFTKAFFGAKHAIFQHFWRKSLKNVIIDYPSTFACTKMSMTLMNLGQLFKL